MKYTGTGTERSYTLRNGNTVTVYLLCNRKGCTNPASYRLRDNSVWCYSHVETREAKLERDWKKEMRRELERAGLRVFPQTLNGGPVEVVPL
jgi:hypothetical protein